MNDCIKGVSWKVVCRQARDYSAVCNLVYPCNLYRLAAIHIINYLYTRKVFLLLVAITCLLPTGK